MTWAWLASACATVAAAFYAVADPGLLPFAFVLGWKVVFISLTVAILMRREAR